jgi:hypothetical protein
MWICNKKAVPVSRDGLFVQLMVAAQRRVFEKAAFERGPVLLTNGSIDPVDAAYQLIEST